MLQRDQGQQASFEESVIGHAFPIQPVRPGSVFAGQLKGSLEELSKTFNRKQSAISPFQKSESWSTRVLDDRRHPGVGWKLYQSRRCSAAQQGSPCGFKIDKESLERWEYLKGAKREPRTNKALGYTTCLAKGPGLPHPIDRPLGPSSQEKVIRLAQNTRSSVEPFAVSRPSNWSVEHVPRRPHAVGKFLTGVAFFMGNYLVVGIIERVGTALLVSIAKHHEDVSEGARMTFRSVEEVVAHAKLLEGKEFERVHPAAKDVENDHKGGFGHLVKVFILGWNPTRGQGQTSRIWEWKSKPLQ